MQIAHLRHALSRGRDARRQPATTAPLPSEELAKTDPKSIVSFHCNICGRHNTVRIQTLDRETISCNGCSSTMRFRAIIELLIKALFGEDLLIDQIPVRKDITGIGVSDTHTYAQVLERKFDYTNTFFHCEPRLDIANVPARMAGCYDFVIASEVFEHVVPPVSKAFSNVYKMLKPGGVLVFTVPFTVEPIPTTEHFPDLYDYTICEKDGVWTLFNRTVDGRDQTYTHLTFHGGPGETLEMRVFSHQSLKQEFRKAGFKDVFFMFEPCLEHGILWPDPWSVPVVARRPAD